MNINEIGNQLNRSIKLAIDSGEARSLDEARRIFEKYQLHVKVGRDIAFSPTLQAALLTVVNSGRRCFLGGVYIEGCPDVELLIPWNGHRTLKEAIDNLQGKFATPCENTPLIVIGDVDPLTEEEFAIRATFDGWVGGTTPLADGRRLGERHEFTPSGVLAGALSVSEAFQFIRGSNAMAGHRDVGMSLWRPEDGQNLFDNLEIGPRLEVLPKQLWLIGLGHLGQSYLWTLGFLPYFDPSEVLLVLQDYDSLVVANDSTSLLTDHTLIGRKKTRAMAEWCEQRGFQTQILERRFASNFQIGDEDPRIALCGVDNALARAALETVGFSQIIEAGLGTGTNEFLAFQIHCFPGRKSSKDLWGDGANIQNDSILEQPAYESLASAGADRCGLTMLAGRSAGASFVGGVVSCLVIAELLRMCIGYRRYDAIDGTLRMPENILSVPAHDGRTPFNPGVTKADGLEPISALA